MKATQREQKDGEAPVEKELRKKQNRLGISGIAVIAFGLWNIAKVVINAVSSPDGFHRIMKDTGLSSLKSDEATLLLVVLLVVLAIDLGLRFLVGFSARAESKGKKKSIFYLIVAAVLLAGSVISIITIFASFFADSVFDTIIAIILELSSILALLDVIVSSAGIRALKKKIAAES